jgi:chromate transporter
VAAAVPALAPADHDRRGAGPADRGRGTRERRGPGVGESQAAEPGAPTPSPEGSVLEVLRAALGLGLTSFGGPIAHIGYFRSEYVEKRGWLDEAAFADLVALTQALPGPASSELGIAIGTRRAGLLGGVVAWVGFTLPSAIALTSLGIFAASTDVSNAGWVHGLKLAAVAVVAQAVWLMARRLTPDWPRRSVAVVAAAVALLWTTPLSQVAIIASGAAVGWLLLRPPEAAIPNPVPSPVGRHVGVVCLVAVFVLLLGLPLARGVDGQPLALFDAFYRSGALVFGGGHVVLPLLHTTVVDPGWVTDSQFLAGYGAAQAVPGPLFTFSAYLGAVSGPQPNGVAGATLALVGIFLPAFLLVFAALPFWDRLRAAIGFRRALNGVNAAVVGLLLAALYNPVWTGAVSAPIDVAVAAGMLPLLLTGRVPPIVVVALSAIAGQAIAALPA